MDRKFHPISIEDREMFAYNANYQQRKQQQLDAVAPELRIKYCFEFLKGYVADGDDLMAGRCYDGIAKYSDKLDWSESHFLTMNTAFVSPKSKKAKNRFCNLMQSESECIVEQNKGDRVFLRSLNGKNFFWVNINSDSDWEIEF